jgi:tRNA dimethylallyltransferase
MSSPPILRVICGPTASGKSVVGLYLAEREHAEILSIDSMKIYRRLSIGTAKPDVATRDRVVHHLVDVEEPSESFSVAEFARRAMDIIGSAAERGVPLIGEGGTPLYLKALTEGLFEGPGRDVEVRSKLELEAESGGIGPLYIRLQERDPKAAAKILPSDLRRIVRALEVLALTGKPISEFQSQWGTERADLKVKLACLNLPRADLYARIDRRVDAMLAAGWLEECRELQKLDPPLSREASQALGYRTLFDHLEGRMSLKDARDRICFDTHHFARRQIGWFKRMPSVRFIDIAEDEDVATIARRVEDAWTART